MSFGTESGPCVLIRAEDSGVGMSQEVMENIFDPFFTTKEVGSGTGLGLSTSQPIIRRHGGFIQAYSEVGKGTRFNIYLPARIGETEDAAPTPAPMDGRPYTAEMLLTILREELDQATC